MQVVKINIEIRFGRRVRSRYRLVELTESYTAIGIARKRYHLGTSVSAKRGKVLNWEEIY